MSSFPSDLKYAKSHEWARSASDGTVTVGITDHAQEQLGDIVYIELPVAGRAVKAGESCAVIESVKAASDIYSPISGTITEVNGELANSPESVNRDAYAGWLFKVQASAPSELAALLDADGYRASVGE